MITLDYSKNGFAYSDFKIPEIVEDIVSKHNSNKKFEVEIIFSTENIFNYFRVMVAEGKINGSDVNLKLNGTYLGTLNEYGCTDRYLEGFCEFSEGLSARVLKAQFKKLKKHK